MSDKKEDVMKGFEALNTQEAKENEVRKKDEAKKGAEEEDVQEGQELQDKEGVQDAQEDVQEEQVDTSEESESSEEESSSDNMAIPIAENLKERGFLPDDFEITEDLDPVALEDAVVNYYDELRGGEVKSKYAEELEEYGYDQNTAQLNKIKSYGVSEEELRNLQAYNDIANYELDPDSENYEEDVKKMGLNFFLSKGFSKDEAENFLETEFEKNEVEDLDSKYKNYFKNEAENLQKTVSNKVEQGKKSEQERKEKEREQLLKTLESKKVDGKEYSDQDVNFYKDFRFKKTAKVKDKHGNLKRVTPYEKMQMELASNPEKALRMEMDMVLGYNADDIKKETETKTKRNLVDGLNKYVKSESKDNKDNSKSKSFEKHFEKVS